MRQGAGCVGRLESQQPKSFRPSFRQSEELEMEHKIQISRHQRIRSMKCGSAAAYKDRCNVGASQCGTDFECDVCERHARGDHSDLPVRRGLLRRSAMAESRAESPDASFSSSALSSVAARKRGFKVRRLDLPSSRPLMSPARSSVSTALLTVVLPAPRMRASSAT